MKQKRKKLTRERTSIFGLFFLISLLLHLLAGLLLQSQQIMPKPQSKPEQTPVALQERKNWLELDQEPLDNVAKPPEEATHIAEANVKVDHEAAPKGEESRDRQQIKKQEQQIAQQTPAQPPPQKPVTRPIEPAIAAPSVQTDTSEQQSSAIAGEPDKRLEKLPINLPHLSKLTNLSPKTLARLDRQEQKQRTKDRPEIESEGDEVWLNLRQDNDKLISFFRRFSDRIEAVWNYPVEASSQGVEGTLLIKIIVNKKGELIDAFPLESSGSEVLDYEAITAVYRAAPFGELPSGYKHDQLKIYAHFQYSLNRRMIYGRP